MAELMLRAWQRPDVHVVVASAGTAALVGHPIDPPSARALDRLGIDGSGHRGRQYRPSMAARAHLVLTAARAHRDQVLTDVPGALRRTFTMREFARLAEHLHAGEPTEVIAEAAALRAMYGKVPARADDVRDPYRRGESRAQEAAETVAATVRATLSALGLGPGPAGGEERRPPRPAPGAGAPSAASARPSPRPRPRASS
jgi:protein-tyrosine phosphatase